MALRQFQRLFQIGPIGHRPLRIGRIAKIKRTQARQRILTQIIKRGDKTIVARGGEIMRLRAGRNRRAGINLIKRVGHGHQPAIFGWGDLRGQKQPFARAVKR